MPRPLRLTLALAALWLIALPARAQETIQIEPTTVEYTMGGQIRFETQLPPEMAAQEVWVFVHPLKNPGTIAGQAALQPSNGVTYTLDLAEHPIPAYATVEFWYRITLEDGSTLETDPETFVYADNRFDWQTLEAAPFEVFWYEGDTAFGQEILNAAQEGMQKTQGFLPVPAPDAVSIYVYASAAELQTALRLTGETGAWIAGHASPELGSVLVTLPPGPSQTYEIKRQVPHEIAHVLLYEWLGDDYYNLPQWLREGVPSMSELFPNPDYVVLLNQAYADDTLLPMASLCESFPLEASNFLLAYAQSTSFTWFIYEQYGSSGLESLALAYADGLGCEQGAETALGKSLTELERDWRQATFGENPLPAVLKDLAPWLLLLAVVLLPSVVLIVGRRTGGG
jgi:hypothetical protein